MAEMSLSQFKSRLVNGGARPNLFEVEGSFPVAVDGGGPEDLRFFCKAAQIPAATFGLTRVPWRGRVLQLPGDRTYDPWTITIINDENFKYRNAFEEWQAIINDSESNISIANGLGAGEGFLTDWRVYQLNRKGHRIKGWKMVDVWPSNIAAIELSNDTTDTIEEFQVTLIYQYWIRIGTAGVQVTASLQI